MLLRYLSSKALLRPNSIKKASYRYFSDNIKQKNQEETQERHQNVDQGFSPYPWETNDILDTEADSFPWESSVDDSLGETVKLGSLEVKKETAVDPTRAELILGPIKKKSQNRNRKSMSDDFSIDLNNTYRELLDFKHKVSDSDMISNIESLKPKESLVSQSQLKSIAKSLDRMCRRNHLLDYLNERNLEIASKLTSRSTKKSLIQVIITRLWNLKIDQSQMDAGTQEVECTIDLTHKRDIFLLSSSRGVLFDHWSLMGAKLTINTSTRELIVKGSQNIVDFVQTSWNQMLNGVVCRKLKLGPLLDLYKDSKGTDESWLQLINGIQQETGAYFELLDDESQLYLVSAINKHVLHSVKTEFIKMINYQDQSQITVLNDLISGDSLHLPLSEKSLPWFVKSQNMYQPIKIRERASKSKLVDDLVNTEQLSREIQQLQLEVTEAEELFEFNYVKSDAELLKETEKEDDFDKFFGIQKHVDSNTPVVVDSMANKLDLSFVENNLESGITSKYDENRCVGLDSVISAKLGHLLFTETSGLTFLNTQIPEITKKISSLPLMNKAATIFGTTGGIKTNFTNHISIKLSPDLFSNKETDLPSLEIVINLKGNIVELQSFDQSRLWDLYMNESEKTVQCPLSFDRQFAYDINWVNSKNSLLVYNLQDWNNYGKDSEIFKGMMQDENNISLFNKSSVQKSLNLINRKPWDIRKYQELQQLMKGISSKTFNFAIPLRSSDSDQQPFNTFKYRVVSVDLVKTLELDFDGSPLILEILDNGNDSKLNLSLIKEQESFQSFAHKSLKLVKYLTN